jgi:hypothetical protein
MPLSLFFSLHMFNFENLAIKYFYFLYGGILKQSKLVSCIFHALPIGCLYTLLRAWEMALRSAWQQSSLVMLSPPCGKRMIYQLLLRKSNFFFPSLRSATTTIRSISQPLMEMSLFSGEVDVRYT